MKNTFKKEILICDCHSVEHQIIFMHDTEDEYPEVFMEVHLNPYHTFWGRISIGMKYIFGHRSRYGAWDGFIFNKDDVHKLEELVKYLKKDITQA